MGFFDKLKEGIEQGVSTVGAKSKEMIDSTKVKMDIDTLKKQKRTAFEEIGSMIYTMLNAGTLDEAQIKAKCDAVTGIDNQINTKEEELKQIQQKA